ncbi:MAG: GxxExxY protein [Alphaproteobacteria bacterium]|nr:GxxExxY protein [Alphaproteobacteria bacterium]
MQHTDLTDAILSSAFEVHTLLGPGLLESVYERCLATELRERGIHVATQVEVPIRYKGHLIGMDLRLDLVVADAVVVEVKALREVHPVHKAQVLSYLRLAGLSVGLLLNFNTAHLRDGITRLVR